MFSISYDKISVRIGAIGGQGWTPMVMLTLDRIILVGCVAVAEGHQDKFVVGLTDENPAIKPPVWDEYFHREYNGYVPPGASAKVSFPAEFEHVFRYVIIQNKFRHKRAMCLAEVQVYVTGM